MRKTLVIFDIDGTLTDSVAVHKAAYINALHEFGLFDYDSNFAGYPHHTDSHIFKTIFEGQLNKPIGMEDLDRFETMLHGQMLKVLDGQTLKEIEGARDFISTLAAHPGFDVVYATGSLASPARLKLQHIGVTFDEKLLVSANRIFIRDELVAKAIILAGEYYSSTYEQMIAFGDGFWDYHAAVNNNIDFIGIANIKLLEHGVPHFYPDFCETGLHDHLHIKKQS